MPDHKLARDGPHRGLLQCALTKAVPRARKASRWGVVASGDLPKPASGAADKSSQMITRRLRAEDMRVDLTVARSTGSLFGFRSLALQVDQLPTE